MAVIDYSSSQADPHKYKNKRSWWVWIFLFQILRQRIHKLTCVLVLLHFAGFWNLYVTKQIWLLCNFPHEETPYYSKHYKKHKALINLILSQSSCKTESLYDTFVALFKQHYVMRPLQNPPLCSSTVFPLIASRTRPLSTNYFLKFFIKYVWEWWFYSKYSFQWLCK